MKLRHFLAMAVAATALSAGAQSGIQNPITQAVLQVYEEELQANPRDYNILLAVPTNTIATASTSAHYLMSTKQSNMLQPPTKTLFYGHTFCVPEYTIRQNARNRLSPTSKKP